MSVINTFAGGELDRAALSRGDMARLSGWGGKGARVLLLDDDRVPVYLDGAPRLALMAVEGAPWPTDPEPVLLGLLNGNPVFAAFGEPPPLVTADDAPATVSIGLREAGETLSQGDGALAAYAYGLLNWHRRHPCCSVCGARCVPAAAGHERHCPNCHAVHHPRIDPVVIMLVSDGDRILLGRRRAAPPGRMSVLAGFVEPGESLEEAVAREVLEEAGVQVTDVRYASSQPWPFPGQLMVGFTARHTAGEPAVGDKELELVGWFDREQVALAAAGRGEFLLPGPVAIARRLIDVWLAGPPARGPGAPR